MPLGRRGVNYERELANWLWSLGFAVIRAPASGGGVRRRFAPDLVAMFKGRVIILEVKYRGKPTPVSIRCDKVNRLIEFAGRAGGEAYVVVKYAREPWRIMPIKPCNGDAAITYTTSEIKEASRLEDLVRSIININLINLL
ncbi:Holliday junction resolvase Hjc [Caldivirga maquilingensis]|uniref:Crossover junction endodeoxyribonuclease Hjc n=1 Tax=Caldivirga maquilingensis (strain ATCC 700844 / DSM 13496 / JCM 10307 / IC-167) TaxID=397948 RepID=A8MDX3_CALMQ|nr:Holliday junction resolvase Hjc [Caldivirga maquilingensis]ABW01979.1 Resolvase, Holliday junction-type [Caldivirga maquilingensis IC-167]